MEFVLRAFDDLTPREVHDVLRLRAEVFVVEQDCPFVDPDAEDLTSQHLLGRIDGELHAYLRWAAHERGLKVGRIVTSRAARGGGHGHALLREALGRIGHRPLFMHAQAHLAGFYEKHGFVIEGDPFPEDGIPHVLMVREAGA